VSKPWIIDWYDGDDVGPVKRTLKSEYGLQHVPQSLFLQKVLVIIIGYLGGLMYEI